VDERDVRAVLFEQQVGGVLNCMFGIRRRLQRVELRPNSLRGVGGWSRRLGEHHCKRLANEANAICGERWTCEVVVHLDEAVLGSNTEVRGSPNSNYARHRQRLRDINRRDGGVSDITSNKAGIQRSLQPERC
jgi:hypothetical protein